MNLLAVIALDESKSIGLKNYKLVEPERAPVVGEYALGNGGIKQYHPQPVEPTPDPIIQITNIVFSGAGFDEIQPDGRVDLLADTSTTITFNVALPSGTKLSIPIRNRDTQQLKIVRATVSNGTVSKVFKIVPSGLWEINSDELNALGRIGVDFSMDDIILLVQDA